MAITAAGSEEVVNSTEPSKADITSAAAVASNPAAANTSGVNTAPGFAKNASTPPACSMAVPITAATAGSTSVPSPNCASSPIKSCTSKAISSRRACCSGVSVVRSREARVIYSSNIAAYSVPASASSASCIACIV